MFYIRGRKTWTEHHVALDDCDWKSGTTPRRIHHTAGPQPKRNRVREEKQLLRDTEDFHINTRGYRAIAYSYLIMPSGRVYEGRGFQKQGAHTLGHNLDIGICFPGNYEHDRLTKRQLVAYRMLAARLRLKGARVGKAYPHSDTFSTSCPGNHVVEQLGL